MKKLQVFGWFISSFYQKHKKLIILGISLGILLSFFFIWILPYIPRPNPSRSIGLIGQYNGQNLPNYITQKVSQGLTAILEDGSVVPMLAKKWETSDNGKTYTFTLRDDIFWQDGTEVMAADLNYQFNDVTTQIIDDKTLIFKLKDAYAPFPVLVAKPMLKNNLIGTGLYKLKQVRERTNSVAEVILEGKSDTLRIKFYPNLSMAKEAFMLGEIDVLDEIYQNPFEKMPQWLSVIKVEEQQKNNQYVAIYLNNKDPLFKDNKSFRQALAYVTPKKDDQTRALGPISPKSWAYNNDLKPYNYSPKRARELAEKAFGNLDKVKETSIRLDTSSNFLDLADEIKNQWQEVLDIQVEVNVASGIDPKFQMLLTSQEIPVDPDQYSLWHSTQSLNIIGLKSPRIDKLLEDGRREMDLAKRKEYYLDFQKFFVEESPIIFLYYPKTYTVSRHNRVKNFIWELIQLNKPKS